MLRMGRTSDHLRSRPTIKRVEGPQTAPSFVFIGALHCGILAMEAECWMLLLYPPQVERQSLLSASIQDLGPPGHGINLLDLASWCIIH